MKFIIHSFVFLIPFYSIGLFIGGKYISITHISALFLACISLLIIVEGRMKFSHLVWAKYFLWFLGVSFLGLLTSRYAPDIFLKGMIQIVGMLVMLGMAFLIVRYIQMKPERLYQIIRVMMLSVGLMAIVGVVQFFIFNLLPNTSIGSFDFLNSLAGGSVWRDPGYIGPIHRVNSFAAEPTAMARYLCLGLGFALIRLGFTGKVMQRELIGIVPLWVAISIVIAMLVSLSVNAWLLIVVVAVSLIILPKKISARMFFRVASVSTIILASLMAIAYTTEGSFLSKLTTVALVFDSSGVDTSDNAQLSALAVASNITVALKSLEASPLLGGGLGSHPLSYAVYAPWYVGDMSVLDGLNADDAASLLFRLISEVGIVGTSLFLFALANIIYRARRRIMSPITEPKNKAITLALGASCMGMVEIYLTRTGHYYDPVFWVLIALTIASLALFRKSSGNKLCI